MHGLKFKPIPPRQMLRKWCVKFSEPPNYDIRAKIKGYVPLPLKFQMSR